MRAVSLRAAARDPPADGKADLPRTPGKIGWNWETLLSNRVVDVWMHEQDIRRAVGRPGGMNTAAAAHTVATFTRSFPMRSASGWRLRWVRRPCST